MGSEALADGFALLGFEIFTNATQDDVEKLLAGLLKQKQKALIFLEDSLAKSPKETFLHARSEAAGIIITEIPALNAPETYRPMVEDLVIRVLGASVLDKA